MNAKEAYKQYFRFILIEDAISMKHIENIIIYSMHRGDVCCDFTYKISNFKYTKKGVINHCKNICKKLNNLGYKAKLEDNAFERFILRSDYITIQVSWKHLHLSLI